MNNVKDLYEKNQKLDCTGCGACVAACAFDCISMEFTEEGFYRPEINGGCKQCGICAKICSRNAEQELFDYTKSRKYYAYLSDEEALRSSASGGVAQAMAQYAISNGWGVLGTIYDNETHTAKAIYTHNMEDITKMCGSKYIPSDTGNAMKKCIEDKQSTVLFIGTPCMCHGMKNLAEKLHRLDKFYFVDFVCHGVPSLNLWTSYIKEVEGKNGKIEYVNFRSKSKGWQNKGIEFEFENGKTLFSKREKDDFMKLYDASFLMNASCFACHINNGFGCADVRLGDYWGERFKDNRTGVSRCSVATEKGKNLFECIKENIVYGETPELTYRKDNTYYLLERKNTKLKNSVLKKMGEGASLKQLYKIYWKSIPLKRRIFSKMPKVVRDTYSGLSRRMKNHG